MAVQSDQVSVVVIVYNDAEHVTGAVRSALDQGDAVGEVIVVDDCSADATLDVLAAFHGDPRVRVIARTENSGGCGTPRNDGLDAATRPYVLFLDSDDLLFPGAVDGLLAAAHRHGTDVTVGVCVRRELPDGVETVWAPQLYDATAGAELPGAVLDGIADHPELLLDTLSVNKLYRRDFLSKHEIRFPDGAFHYEDFVFTARVYAAAPSLAVTDVPVYVWHVRRAAATLSISLRRASVANWEHRVAAHQGVVDVFREAGADALAVAAQTKFLAYDMPMYLRELPQRSADYQDAWWASARAHLAAFEPSAVSAAPAPSRWLAAALSACPEPLEVNRLAELAAAPARLVPPYARDASGGPVLAEPPMDVALDGLGALPPAQLPVAVDGRLTIGPVTRLSLTLHDVYGRLAELRPAAARISFADRAGVASDITVEAPLVPDGEVWTAAVRVPTGELARAGGYAAWSLRAEIRYADGATTTAEIRAAAGQYGRRGIVFRRPAHAVLLQAHVTARRALIVRVAVGAGGVRRVLGGRIRRLLTRR